MEHGFDVEEVVEQFHDDDLTHDDHADDGAETTALLQAEITVAGSVGAGVEHVPEVRPYEDREEQRLLVGSDVVVGAGREVQQVHHAAHIVVLEDVQEAQRQGKEEQPYAHDIGDHRAVQDEGAAVAWRIGHHGW